jgi:hypothetical protein
MRSVHELDHDKDQMAVNCPYARAFMMILEVLEDRNNHIGE